jgi:hypothetical protein
MTDILGYKAELFSAHLINVLFSNEMSAKILAVRGEEVQECVGLWLSSK